MTTLRDIELHAVTLADRGLLRMPQLIDGRRALLVFRQGELEWFARLMSMLREVYGEAS